jgi:excisionase family DNA binding protein
MIGRLLTARHVADNLGLTTETVLAWVRNGNLPAFKLPNGAIRFREEDLDNWLAERATSKRKDVTQTADAARPTTLSSAMSPKPENGDRHG